MYAQLALCLLALLASPSLQIARFDNYKVYRVFPTDDSQNLVLSQLEDMGYDLWSFGKKGVPVDVMVPPHLDESFQDLVSSLGLEPTVFIDNVQDRIDNEKPQGAMSTKDLKFGWNSYYRLDEIYDWLKSLADQYPKWVTLVRGGQTSEGREILGVHVSFDTEKNYDRGVFIEGGIHAREWISVATTTYILNEILTSKDRQVRKMAESHDWYIFPSTNPDGYEYTHTKDRMWRKTRSKTSVLCYGADPNRNWGFNWNTGGVSNSPCSETYCGSAAFSEIETKTLADYIGRIAGRLKAYLSIHSYSQLILIPYGTSSAGKPDNFDLLQKLGDDAAKSLSKRYGTKYTVGNIVEVLYTASGSSLDYAKGVHNVNLTYVYELRDTGTYGFILPANQIIPTGEETLDSFITLLKD